MTNWAKGTWVKAHIRGRYPLLSIHTQRWHFNVKRTRDAQGFEYGYTRCWTLGPIMLTLRLKGE